MFARRIRRSLKTWDVPILQSVSQLLFQQSQERREQLQKSQHKGYFLVSRHGHHLPLNGELTIDRREQYTM